jgi:hypothetical protein
VTPADVLEHPDRHDRVEDSRDVAVVLEGELHGQPGRSPPGEIDLLPGHGDADDLRAVALRGERREPAPAAADVEDAHPRLQPDLSADEVELCLLSLFQQARFLPVAAAVEHPPVEHGFVEVVAEIVVSLADLECLRAVPPARQPRAENAPKVSPGSGPVVEAGREDAAEERLELVAIPPAVHIALAQAERTLREDAVIEPDVVDSWIPGCISTEANPRRRQKLLQYSPVLGHSCLLRRK